MKLKKARNCDRCRSSFIEMYKANCDLGFKVKLTKAGGIPPKEGCLKPTTNKEWFACRVYLRNLRKIK